MLKPEEREAGAKLATALAREQRMATQGAPSLARVLGTMKTTHQELINLAKEAISLPSNAGAPPAHP